jgi:putative PIN family toxin of toxin-antitoxin system
MTPARIVVDTNVIVAALTSPAGSNREVLRCCLAGVVEPLVGTTLFHEYESIVSRKSVQARCPLQPVEREEFLNAFLGRCVWVRISFRWRPNLADESDNHLMELAVAGGAKAIITNNVRDLKSGELIFPDIEIMTPSSFLKTPHAKTIRRRP